MKSKPDPNDPYGNFLDAYVDMLTSMSSEEVLKDVDQNAVIQKHESILANALRTAGKNRLEAARSSASRFDLRSQQSVLTVQVSVEDARFFLQEAANSGDYTMAAREVNELSDSDVLQLYSQLVALRALKAQSD